MTWKSSQAEEFCRPNEDGLHSTSQWGVPQSMVRVYRDEANGKLGDVCEHGLRDERRGLFPEGCPLLLVSADPARNSRSWSDG